MSDQKWTLNDMPDLSGKTIVVTGANSGIGYDTAKAFVQKGAKTILACRSMDKANATLAELKREMPNASAEVMRLDLASLASVRQFVADFRANHSQLDILVNNAGIMMVPYGKTEDGFERQLGTNHFGHFALTGLLFDDLQKSEDSRVVNVSSIAHGNGEMDFSNLMYEGGGYNAGKAYGRSKLANLLFTYEMQRRLDASGSNMRSIACHPGITQSNLANHLFDPWYMRPIKPIFNLLLQGSEMGALPTIRAAVDPKANGGSYYGPDGRGQRSGYPIVVKSNRASRDEADAKKLWKLSEELTGMSFLS
ncbi:MAG: oxidoreductase [Chloroflexota bacterium]